MAATSPRFDALCDSTYHYCVCRDKLRQMVLDLEADNKKLRDEVKKLEYALEQIRSTVVEITG